ncbi:TraB/GumN family protein [Aliiglaciecola sp. M165]|uniref:TraB/GumN family protein n=1 Tax=Aliiglaciecola sp. M165 TaxID=2593649 RepID=UPI00117BE79E|nr:TraB/GumN family protein [Aliiglaciecola sp. M165]TRY30217.1 TraB/GumN family protein [Aliiglaciecola sp. M165]
MFKKLFITLFTAAITLNCQAASVWKVSKGQDQIYVGGTIHLLSQNDYPLPEKYEQAYKMSDTLVFETDIAKMNSPEFQQVSMQYMFLPGGKTVKELISAETFAQLETHLAARNIPVQNFLPFLPSFLAITLTVIELQMMGINSAGVDMYFATKGIGDGKANQWFEEPEEQLSLLAKMGEGQEDAMIKYTLKDISTVQEMMPKMITAWREGDSQALADIGLTDMMNDYPQVYNDLLVQRNKNWLPKLEALFGNENKEFVLVGALHLVGKDSVLAMLESKGYKVEKM